MLSSQPLAVEGCQGAGEPVRFLLEWRQGRREELSGFSCPYLGQHCFLLPSFTIACGSCSGMALKGSPRVGGCCHQQKLGIFLRQHWAMLLSLSKLCPESAKPQKNVVLINPGQGQRSSTECSLCPCTHSLPSCLPMPVGTAVSCKGVQAEMMFSLGSARACAVGAALALWGGEGQR